MIVKDLNRLPSYRLSETKSIDQYWSALIADGNTKRQWLGRFFLRFLSDNPSCR